MDTGLATTIVSSGGAVLVGVFGMFFTANQIGRRIDDLRVDTNRIGELRSEFNTFRDVMNSKFDLAIAKLMDKRG